MSKIIPLFDSVDELALRLKLPKRGEYYDWFALPWDVFSSWFKWIDKEDEKKLYLVYDPPTERISAYYDYSYSHYYNIMPNLKTLPASAKLDIIDEVFCCTFGCLIGTHYSFNRIVSPKSGKFVNMVDVKEFKPVPHKAIIKKGDTPFYIDYSIQ